MTSTIACQVFKFFLIILLPPLVAGLPRLRHITFGSYTLNAVRDNRLPFYLNKKKKKLCPNFAYLYFAKSVPQPKNLKKKNWLQNIRFLTIVNLTSYDRFFFFFNEILITQVIHRKKIIDIFRPSLPPPPPLIFLLLFSLVYKWMLKAAQKTNREIWRARHVSLKKKSREKFFFFLFNACVCVCGRWPVKKKKKNKIISNVFFFSSLPPLYPFLLFPNHTLRVIEHKMKISFQIRIRIRFE